MTFIATANCPACNWRLKKPIETHGTTSQQIDIANAVIDPILSDHLEHHPTIKKMLLDAGEAPLGLGMKATNGFRGLFDLKYREMKI